MSDKLPYEDWINEEIIGNARKGELMVAAARAERMRDDYEQCIAALEAERDAAVAAAQWTPVEGEIRETICVSHYDSFADDDSCNYEIFSVTSQGIGVEHTGFTFSSGDEDLSICRRNPAAKVWRVIGAADPDIECAHGVMVSTHSNLLAIRDPDGSWHAAELPDGKALCELVAALLTVDKGE